MTLLKSLRKSRGLFIWNSFKQGKLGVDAYFVAFALIGMTVIPYYLYNNLMPHRNFVRNNLGITKENMPDFWK